MYHRLAKKAAKICLDKNWIPFEQYDWCIYAFEKHINTISMFALILCIAILVRKTIEISFFLGSFITLRRRIGGWHSKYAWTCHIVSIIVLLLVLFVIGPNIELFNLRHIALLNMFVILACATICPIYPSQLYFDNDIIEANHRKKNRALFVIALIQIFSCFAKRYALLTYSFLGILVAFIALVAEWVRQNMVSQNRKGGVI